MPAFVSSQIAHFKQLPEASRALIRSFGSYYIALPLLSTFTAAFLWENVTSKTAVPVFYLGIYPGLAVGFYLSGLGLRLLSLQQLYAFGLIFQALPVFYLSITRTSGVLGVGIAGLIMGICSGLYWSTRNLLTLQLTHEKHRDYFFGTDSFIVTISSTVLPIIFGILIDYGFFFGNAVDRGLAFTLLMLILLGILLLGARGILRASLGKLYQPKIFLSESSSEWNHTRLLLFIFGCGIGSVSYLPPLLILSQFKGQSQLGGLQSFAALLSAFILYRLGTIISSPQHRMRGMFIATVSLSTATIPLVLGLKDWNVLLFGIATGFLFPFIWNCLNPATFRAIDACSKDPDMNFAYVCDRELFLDIGRSVGTIACIVVTVLWSIDQALIYMPYGACALLFLAVAQLRVLTRIIDGK